MTDYLERTIDFNHPDIASVVDELSFWSSRFGHMLFDLIEIRKDINILDVGCATGFPLFELAHVFGGSCNLTGIDIWREALERARFKLQIHALSNVRIIEADAARQPFDNAEFDLIVSNLGINNWEDPSAVLAECFRVARPNAQLVLTTNVVGHYKEFYEVFAATLREMEKAELLEKLDSQAAHRGTRASLSSLLEESGWKLTRIVENSFEMRFADGSALLRHSLVLIGFLGGWRNILAGLDESEVFRRIENRLNTLAQEGGELRMTVPMLYLEAKKI
ncbi:MAG: class I SAM-dependent methyltransferase [Acidobacteria bacterium]|nr:class I SAM-dependent methyltransferase [Acidobacteriota bacterium]